MVFYADSNGFDKVIKLVITSLFFNPGVGPLWRNFFPLSIFFSSSSINQKTAMIKSSIVMS
jgi:hypothetical protein